MYGNGLKMMEHSYVNNIFVRAVENELLDCPQRLVWAGDYADEIEGMPSGDNYYFVAEQEVDRTQEMLNSDRFFNERNTQKCFDTFIFPLKESCKYIKNHTTKEFVRIPEQDEEELTIHPLPLLTTDSQQGAGGDYRGADPNNLIGRWAGHIISVTNEEPEAEFLELIFDLKED